MREVLTLLFCLFLGGFSWAQEDPAKLQEKARLKFEELHERMQKLQVLLASTEPESAKTLEVGNRHIQESQLHEAMREVKKLIDGEQWDAALTKMDGVRKDLNSLLDLLLNRNLDLKKLLEEIARLENFLKRVDQLAKDQQAEKDAASETEALEQHLKDLEAAKQKLDELTKGQKDLREQANQAGMAAAPQKAAEMGNKQGDLKTDAEKLAEQLKKLEDAAKKLASKSAPKDDKSDKKDGKSSGSSSGSCSGAGQAMGKSQQSLNQNQPERSLQDQDQALKKLEDAKNQLAQMTEEAKRKLLALPFEQQIRAQETTKIETDKLAKDMDKSEQGENGEKKDTPGKENIQNAVPMQKAAAGQLKEYKASKAKQNQQDAKDQLDEAKKRLEDALNQLRQQMQDEILRSLEERFGAMLAKQKELSARTKTAERVRGEALVADNQIPEAIVQRIGEIAGGEQDLGIEASDAKKLLEEEATTAVFPEIVAELQEDLTRVTGMLRENKTGQLTQQRQADIEETLKMLIDALRKTIELKENGGQCGH